LGWLVLEHLAWAINHDYHEGRKVMFLPTARPPFLNFPGKTLCFVIEGYENEDPDRLAEFLNQVRKDLVEKI
jgi:hypothetical protein